MNTTVTDGNESVYSNDSISEESLLSQITGLYLPLVFRPVLVTVVTYLAVSAIDGIQRTLKRYPNQFDSIEFFFLINLLISDIVTTLVGNIVAISAIMNTIVNPNTKGVGCYIIAASRSPNCAMSLFVAVFCFDRLMFFAYHNHYVEFMTKRRRYIVVATVWLLSIVGNLVIIFDPTMKEMTKNGVCIHRPFINHYGTVVLLLPAVLAVVLVVIQNVYVFYAAYQSDVQQIRQRSVSGTTADDRNNDNNGNDGNNQRRRKSRCMRVLRLSCRRGCSAIFLAFCHLIFGALFPLVEYLVCPKYEGEYLYDFLTSVVFVVFEFINLMMHPLFYAFYVGKVWDNLRHQELYLYLCGPCCRPRSNNTTANG